MRRAYLDNAVLARSGIKCILDIALADHPEMTNDVDRRRPQHVIVLVRERLRRRDDDRIARMNTQGIKVLTITSSGAKKSTMERENRPPCCTR